MNLKSKNIFVPVRWRKSSGWRRPARNTPKRTNKINECNLKLRLNKTV